MTERADQRQPQEAAVLAHRDFACANAEVTDGGTDLGVIIIRAVERLKLPLLARLETPWTKTG